MIPLKTESGEERAWTELRRRDPLVISRSASVSCDADNVIYTVTSFGMHFHVSVKERTVTGATPQGEEFLREYRDLFVPSVLFYLIESRDISETGRLVSPADLKGGHIFTQGTHLLPLDRVADRYGHDKGAFHSRGVQLGGQISSGGDAAVKLYPFPRLPATVLLWLADDEFPARAILLFDSSCSLIAPVDVLWATAMVSVLTIV